MTNPLAELVFPLARTIGMGYYGLVARPETFLQPRLPIELWAWRAHEPVGERVRRVFSVIDGDGQTVPGRADLELVE